MHSGICCFVSFGRPISFVAYGDMVIAMSIAKWYFTRDKRQTGNATVISAFCDTGTYHIGTLAFGSLVLAIVQFIRAISAKIQQKSEASRIRRCRLLAMLLPVLPVVF
jgi:hypothetical protein